MSSSQYILLLVLGTCCIYGLWRTSSLSWQRSTVHAKASIQFDLSIPASSASVLHRSFNRTSRKLGDRIHRRYRGAMSKYMLELYHRRSDVDIVRALQPIQVTGPTNDGARILVFSMPPVDPEETLEVAELLGVAGAILRVRLDQVNLLKSCTSRRDDSWRAFNVTSVVTARDSSLVRLRVYGRVGYQPCGDGPILLLSYSKTKKKRPRRSVQEEDQVEEDGARRRRRNSCRRRSLYVDFALIAYDQWVVAPPGYEAYQCAGKCFYPFGDHLSPTKHAIVQTLVHGALQGNEGLNKLVGRACCVPTRLAPTSLLYLDASGTLTYQYGYEDMVVAECGCR
ncbi:PREDICTED: inhibin beta A chain-like [Dufourea novaeangliae]|uniref:Bone morphogenetic protein 10 n=1 Tax=Dufourea novaeangliae TaxID=178035 RepID=A0A154PSN3_DUFNO|nr:PREDICTED: inhibin beta A chain-like [Dufourea novaeangliae]KZC14767.1 Bone morphogenetic protein 10 [Dufourea novaeangliae]